MGSRGDVPRTLETSGGYEEDWGRGWAWSRLVRFEDVVETVEIVEYLLKLKEGIGWSLELNVIWRDRRVKGESRLLS